MLSQISNLYRNTVEYAVDKAFDKIAYSENREIARETTKKTLKFAVPVLCAFAATVAPLSTILGGAIAGVITHMNKDSLKKCSKLSQVAIAVATLAFVYFLPALFTASMVAGFAGIDFVMSDAADRHSSFKDAIKDYSQSKLKDLRTFFEKLAPAKEDTKESTQTTAAYQE